ncbi:MAG: hypothetical protein Q7S34_04430 [bacterium]|nr:hypothetical protein [bacterium]
MYKNLVITLGVLVAVLPFISIPGSMKTPLYIIFGVTVAVIGYQEKHPKRKGFLGAVVRRGRKIINPISSHASHLSPFGTEITNQAEALKNTNEQTGVPTKQ